MSSGVGRPRASSRATLAEAACELFLEQGFEATSIVEIAHRAGVSRSSFFNYFASKADVLWAALDERIAQFEQTLTGGDGAVPGDLEGALRGLGEDFEPDSLALAYANAEQMGVREELDREAGVRRTRLARLISENLCRAGVPQLNAEVAGAAHAGAVLAAIEAWSVAGPGRQPLAALYADALAAAAATLPGGGEAASTA